MTIDEASNILHAYVSEHFQEVIHLCRCESWNTSSLKGVALVLVAGFRQALDICAGILSMGLSCFDL